MAKPKLGSGARFKALTSKIAARGGVKNPAAVAAAAGRKKYGKKKFAALGAAGRHHAALKRHVGSGNDMPSPP